MDRDDLADLFAPLGPVEVKRMFGGHGIFCDGRMFALESGGDLFIKADGDFAQELAALGCAPLGYTARNRQVTLPYWTLPEAALDDPEAREALFRRAQGVARAGAARKARGKKAASKAPAGPAPDFDALGIGVPASQRQTRRKP
jgi:DNA transformation protein